MVLLHHLGKIYTSCNPQLICSSMESKLKPHAVVVPYPSQGHITPMMAFAKLLHSNGFHITFVNTHFNHNRLVRSMGPDSVKGSPDFRFEMIPDGLPMPDPQQQDFQDIPLLSYYTRMTCLEPFKNLLASLDSTPPRVSCVVSDGVMGFGRDAARDFRIPGIQFWTASVSSFIGYLNFRELVRRGIFPFQNEEYLTDGRLDAAVDWIEGMSGVSLKVLPSFLRTTDANDIMFNFMGEEAQDCLKASAIIFNSFRELEEEALNAVISHCKCSNIYTIGPLHLLADKHMQEGDENRSVCLNSSLWKPDPNVINWLDSRQPDQSVVYVNYGSVSTMSATHLHELAWGIAESGHPFLWVIRPDVVRGESKMLDEGFVKATKDRGLVVNWCVQDQVLAHRAVGVFLTHCGWNSMLESISCGAPVICWPFFADQQTNCHYSCTKWGIGMELDHDVKRGEVAKLVKAAMEGEKGKEMRMRAKEWKSIAEKASDVGGESYNNFDEFIKKYNYCKDCLNG